MDVLLTKVTKSDIKALGTWELLSEQLSTGKTNNCIQICRNFPSGFSWV